MKLKLAAVALCAAGIAVPAFAGDVEDIKAVVNTAEKAFNSCDVAALEGINHPDISIFNSDGTLGTRDEFISSMKASCEAGNTIQRKFTVLKVDVRGDMAVVAMTDKGATKSKDGEARPFHLKLSGVMIKDGDGWRTLHVHVSPIMNANGQ